MLLKFTITVAVLAFMAGAVNADWKKVPSGTMAWLHAVHFVDDRRGWIGGSNGTLLTTQDGGGSWEVNDKFTNDSIRDVYFSDPSRGWLLCERPIFSAVGSPAYLMVTDDGGTTWQKREPFESRDRVVKLLFRNRETGCAIGEGGFISCTDDGGLTWRRSDLPVRYLMLDGAILEPDTLVLVGGGGTVLRSERGRTNWTRAVTMEGRTAKINSLHFYDRKTGWAVGADGAILYTSSGGNSWSIQRSPVNKELRDVLFDGPSVGYAVGQDGVIIHTTNGGTNWIEQERMTKHRLEALAATGKRVIAVGFGGSILVIDERKEGAAAGPR